MGHPAILGREAGSSSFASLACRNDKGGMGGAVLAKKAVGRRRVTTGAESPRDSVCANAALEAPLFHGWMRVGSGG
jgi:hypothetical protein